MLAAGTKEQPPLVVRAGGREVRHPHRPLTNRARRPRHFQRRDNLVHSLGHGGVLTWSAIPHEQLAGAFGTRPFASGRWNALSTGKTRLYLIRPTNLNATHL